MMNSIITKFRFIVFCLLSLYSTALKAQVRIRIFADSAPASALFSVTESEYFLIIPDRKTTMIHSGESVIISKYNTGLVVKTGMDPAFICDSVHLAPKDTLASFSLRINSENPVRQYYKGDLKCFPDLGTIVFINISDIDSYLAGVVRAEGGYGRNMEYLKTQAIIARTYMYKYFNKHSDDNYNLCDHVHCQAFSGITNDSLIIRAVKDTEGLVILDKDSSLIISAFHSCCGGETASSEDVWLTAQPYLKKVVDPWCVNSRNAKWKKTLGINEWLAYLKNYGYLTTSGETLKMNFTQTTRKYEYVSGDFSIPLHKIRDDLGLRSTFFSLKVEGDSVYFDGKGYGHGAGLCQEGAMVMAEKGFDFRQIINFYYEGVIVSDINNEVKE